MPKVQLTAAFCAAAKCQPGKRKTDYWNQGDPVGLVFETRESGRATFYLRYQDTRSRQRAIKLGGYPEISLDQARKAARRTRSEVALGADPLAAKQDKKAIPTYADLATQHIAEAKATQRSWWSVDGIIRKHLLPRWGRLRLDEITSQAISLWLAEKAAEGLKPATVDKIRVVFGRSFELALRWGIPGGEKNPVRAVKRAKFDNKRHRYLDSSEAARLLLAAETSTNPQLKPIVHLLILSGARISELLQARWCHVDLARREWLIPTSKSGKSRHVPLSEAAVQIIKQLPHFRDCPYLLPNPETLLPFVSIKRAWQTARREAGLSDLHIHDLRHSAASFMINAGVDLYAVGKILGHAAHSTTTSRYAHVSNSTLLAAVEAGAAGLNGHA